MNPNSIALLLLATAVLLWSRATLPKARLTRLDGTRRTWPSPGPKALRLALSASLGALSAVATGPPKGLLVGALVAAAAWWLARRFTRGQTVPPDPLTLAATWDLLAACLRAGLPVPTAVTAVADDLPADATRALRATADLLAMGADPVDAWAPAMSCVHTAALARGARHTARSGTALADVVGTLATTVRDTASDAAEARAQRAGVLIAAPLGLCFLPAFVCLGIVPIAIGLASHLSL
ncbi:type II secretion system F family protein [Actinophytocola sp.]|uniref:type II secretion system F family protein n=1 Tax=Actinophytocola sp. TaxID=1872138 RepID=UPI002EDB7439